MHKLFHILFWISSISMNDNKLTILLHFVSFKLTSLIFIGTPYHLRIYTLHMVN